MTYRAALALVTFMATLFVGAHGAQASLRFCNKSQSAVDVAIGFVDRERGWVGKGWWVIPGGECRVPIGEALDNRYYYYYAKSQDGTLYAGATGFCIDPKKFTLYQAQYGKNTEADCAEAGLRFAKFDVLDTQGAKNHTVILRAPGASNVPPVASGGGGGTPIVPPPAVVGGNAPPARAGTAAPPPSATGGAVSGTACQRFPNLC